MGAVFSLSIKGNNWSVSLPFRHSCSRRQVQKPLASFVFHEREAGASFILKLGWIAWRSGKKKKRVMAGDPPSEDLI